MMRMRLRTLLLGLALGAGLALAPQASAEDPVRIAFVTHGQSADSYWGVVKKGVDDAAALMGSDVSYDAPQTTDMVAMARMIDAAVAQRVDGLVVSIPDATALEKSVKAAADAGIPVIVIDSGEPEVERLGLKLYIGTTNYYEQGKVAAKRLVEAGVTRGVCANHEPGNLVNESACDGFMEGMKELGVQGDHTEISLDPTDTAARISAYLSAHPETNGILCVGAPAAAYVVAALRENGSLGNYKIGHFDVNADTLAALQAGETVFSFDAQQYLMGYLPVILLTQYARYGVLPTANIYTGPSAVTSADVEQIMALSKKGIR
jgi:simple sugar transport system substrate-binding protein